MKAFCLSSRTQIGVTPSLSPCRGTPQLPVSTVCWAARLFPFPTIVLGNIHTSISIPCSFNSLIHSKQAVWPFPGAKHHDTLRTHSESHPVSALKGAVSRRVTVGWSREPRCSVTVAGSLWHQQGQSQGATESRAARLDSRPLGGPWPR